jgi:hypothetical protein
VGVEERGREEEAVEAAAGGAEAEEGRRREARQHAVHQRLRQTAPHARVHVHLHHRRGVRRRRGEGWQWQVVTVEHAALLRALANSPICC